MISDLCNDLRFSVAFKYADDTKNTAKISNTDDSEHFQEELDKKVYPWAPRNNMCLNGEKGQVQIRVQICPTRSMFSKFNYFDIVASLHKYACYRINKNPYHGHLWITEAREK